MRLLLVAALALSCFSFSACVGYPKVYLMRKAGSVPLGYGRSARYRVDIVRECQDEVGYTEEILSSREKVVGPEGRYVMWVRAMSWDWSRFTDHSFCRTRSRSYLCTPDCVGVDSFDSAFME